MTVPHHPDRSAPAGGRRRLTPGCLRRPLRRADPGHDRLGDPGAVRGRLPARGGLPRRRHAQRVGPAAGRRRRRRAPARRRARRRSLCSTAPARATRALREQICEVMALEGVRAHPDDVVVTTGSQQALDLVTRIFVDPGDVVSPRRRPTSGRSAFRSYQAEVVHVAMDDDGLRPEALRKALEALRPGRQRVKFLYTVPNFHNPAGVTLTAARRRESSRSATTRACSSSRTTPTACSVSTASRARAARRRRRRGDLPRVVLQDVRARASGWAGRVAPHAVRDKLVLATEATQLCPSSFSQLAVSTYLRRNHGRSRSRPSASSTASAATRCSTPSTGMPPGTAWTRPAAASTCGSRCPTASTPRPCCPAPSPRGSPTCPAPPSTPTASGPGPLRLSYCYPDPRAHPRGRPPARRGRRRGARAASHLRRLRHGAGRRRLATAGPADGGPGPADRPRPHRTPESP